MVPAGKRQASPRDGDAMDSSPAQPGGKKRARVDVTQTLGVWATTPTGFEPHLAEELSRVLGVAPDDVGADMGHAIALLPDAARVSGAQIRSVRSAEMLYALVLARDLPGIEALAQAEALAAIEDAVAEIPRRSWLDAVGLLRRVLAAEAQEKQLRAAAASADASAAEPAREASAPADAAGAGAAGAEAAASAQVEGKVQFKVLKKRSGTHAFDSSAFGRSVFLGAARTMTEWEGVLEDPEVTVLASIAGTRILVGVRLTAESQWRSTMLQYPRELAATTLRPVIAYNLVRCAPPEPGDVLLDPMAGGGTLGEVAVSEWPSAFALVGDVDEDLVRVAAKNTRRSPQAGRLDVVRWDARRLPLRAGCVSRYVTDLPFGKRCGSKWLNRELYARALEEATRVLRAGGTAVFMSADEGAVVHGLCRRALKMPDMAFSRQFRANVGGLRAKVLVGHKSDAAAEKASPEANSKGTVASASLQMP